MLHVRLFACLFDASRKVIKDFNSEIKGTFLESC